MTPIRTAVLFSLIFACVVCVPLAANTHFGVPYVSVTHAQVTGNQGSDISNETPKPKKELPEKPAGECSIWTNWSFNDCIWYPAVTMLHNGAVGLGKLLVSFSSSVFNWAFEKTVTNLSGTLDDLKITLGVETVWGAFRDIANIIIIGVMVYIAIATIIGLEEYGYKKLLASTLIIATLINFSLFFARFIIDAANIVSHQVYKSIANQNGGMSIGDTVIEKGGISTLAVGTKETNQYVQKSGVWKMILGAFVTFFLLSAFSAVLLYGAFLLISRGVLLTFLMITSSVAFASYLLPGWRKGQYGWDTWKKTLVDASVFGPLLTLLLWASLTLLGNAGSAGSYGSISESISSGIEGGKNADGSWKALMVLVFTIAFLYISIKIAHELSGKISGFSMAAKVPGGALVGASLAGGLLGRQTLGRLAMFAGKKFESKSKDESASRFTRRLYDFGAQKAKDVGKSDMNLMNTKYGAHISGGIDGKTNYGGMDKIQQERAKAYAEQAARMTPSKEQREDTANKVKDKVLKENSVLGKEKGAADSEHTKASSAFASIGTERDKAAAQVEQIEKELQSQIRDRDIIQKNTTMSREERRTALAEQDSKIKTTQESLTATHAVRVDAENRYTEAKKKFDEAAKRQKTADEDIISAVNARAPGLNTDTQTLAESFAHDRVTNIIPRMFGQEAKNDTLAQTARKSVGESGKKKKMKDRLEALSEMMESETDKKTPPAPEKKVG